MTEEVKENKLEEPFTVKVTKTEGISSHEEQAAKAEAADQQILKAVYFGQANRTVRLLIEEATDEKEIANLEELAAKYDDAREVAIEAMNEGGPASKIKQMEEAIAELKEQVAKLTKAG